MVYIVEETFDVSFNEPLDAIIKELKVSHKYPEGIKSPWYAKCFVKIHCSDIENSIWHPNAFMIRQNVDTFGSV